MAHRGHGRPARVRGGARAKRQRPLRHVRTRHRARGRALPAVRGLEPPARLATRQHVVPAGRALPLVPPRAFRSGRAAGLPRRARALRLALRHRGGGRGHARRPGLPYALGRVREGPARPLRGADGRDPPLADHRAGMDHPARGPGPPPALVAGRRLRGLLGSRARRPAGHPPGHAHGRGSGARRGDPGQRHLRPSLARRGDRRRRGLLPVLLAVERPLARGPRDGAPDPPDRRGAGHGPGRAAGGRLRGLRGAHRPGRDGAQAALARRRNDRGPRSPAWRADLPAAHLAGRAAHRLRAAAGTAAGHRRLGGGPGGSGHRRRRDRHQPRSGFRAAGSSSRPTAPASTTSTSSSPDRADGGQPRSSVPLRSPFRPRTGSCPSCRPFPSPGRRPLLPLPALRLPWRSSSPASFAG